MKTYMQQLFSSCRQGVVSLLDATGRHPQPLIIAGYSTAQDDGSSPSIARRRVGILYADIAEYTRLTEQDEEGTHRLLVESMRVVREQVAAAGGRTAHCAGDAILAEFDDADSAMHCAIKIQLAARHWNSGYDLDRQVRFRIGVNFGDVISDQGDIFGKAVNLAARLEELACSGGICVSETLLSMLEGNPAYRFVALGNQYVKNISRPVKAFWIQIDAQQFIDSQYTGAVKISPMVS